MSLNNNPRCYICLKILNFPQPSIRSQNTTYTQTPITKYLEQLSDQYPLTLTDDELNEIQICDDCQSKLNDYDLACLTAKNIEKDLRDLLKKSKELYIKPEVIIKEEDEHNDEQIKKEPDDNHWFTSSDSSEEEKPLNELKRKSIPRVKKSKKLLKEDQCDEDNQLVSLESTDDEYIPPIELKSKLKHPPVKKLKKTDAGLAKSKKAKKNYNKKKSLIPDSEVPTDLKCSTCGLQTSAIGSYKTHMKTHLKAKQCLFRCKECRMTYKNQADLDVHTEKHKKLGINPLQCVECDQVFSSRNNLSLHIPLHTGEPLFICEMCGREFIHHSSFRRHKLKHANIKTKECPHCGRLFSESSHLSRHLRTHTGEKPFSCTVCDRKFANRYNVKSHMKSHQEKSINSESDLQHTCVVCNKSFAQALLLKGHMKRSHLIAIDGETF